MFEVYKQVFKSDGEVFELAEQFGYKIDAIDEAIETAKHYHYQGYEFSIAVWEIEEDPYEIVGTILMLTDSDFKW